MTGNWNLKWTQESTGVLQPPKKRPRQCHMGIKVENPRLTQLSQNEETRNVATSFLESPTNFSGMYTYQCEPHEESARSWTYRSWVSDGIGGICGPSDRCRNSHRFVSSKKKTVRWRSENCQWNKTCRMYYTTKLSPSVFRPVSLRYTTMRGHTPTMLLTTSTRDGIDSSPVMMAGRRLDRDITQSRCSALFGRVTINSVIEKGSKDPKTAEDTFCKHRFRRRRSEMGYSTSLCEYPLTKYSLYVSASTCDPPKITTWDAELPNAATIDPSTATSCVASTVKRSITSTATRRKVPFSHVRMKAHGDSPRSSNSSP